VRLDDSDVRSTDLADEYEVAPKEFSGREANVADGADVRRASN
jgi:hypothetical protein